MSTRFAVYRFFDADGELVYVGVTYRLSQRLQEHAKKPWWPEVQRQAVEWHPDEQSALAAELKAIKEEKPRYNVAKTNDHQYRHWKPGAFLKSGPLMGTYEISVMFGVSRQGAQQMTARRDFPEPYDQIHAGKLWRRKAVEQWARDHGRVIADGEPAAT